MRETSYPLVHQDQAWVPFSPLVGYNRKTNLYVGWLLHTRFDAIGKTRGMDVCISTTAKSDQEGQKLLALMGMPFREGGGGNTGAIVRKKKLKSHHFDAKGKGKGKR